jgi:hypothetical protein
MSGEEWFVALEESRLFKLFAADIFSSIFSVLSPTCRTSFILFVRSDASDEPDLSFLAQLLSKDRFQHLLLALKRSAIPAGHLSWEEGCSLGGWIGRGLLFLCRL